MSTNDLAKVVHCNKDSSNDPTHKMIGKRCRKAQEKNGWEREQERDESESENACVCESERERENENKRERQRSKARANLLAVMDSLTVS